MFILLKNEEVGSDAEVEFTGENQMLRVKPVHWNERILCVNAPGKQNNKKNTNSCIKIKPLVKKHSALALPGLIFCVFAIADFPAGNVKVTVYSSGVPLSKAQLQYYSNMEEITCLLARAADPVDFMCQVRPLNGSKKVHIPVVLPYLGVRE